MYQPSGPCQFCLRVGVGGKGARLPVFLVGMRVKDESSIFGDMVMTEMKNIEISPHEGEDD